MKKLLSCAFNMDSGCVELKFNDGSMIAINCTAVENEVADNMYQRSELDYLILHEVASDGASELLAARINEMSDEDYTQYLRYHFYICEKPELLGMTNHLLFMGEKK